MYDRQKCDEMPIESLGVSADALEVLKMSGVHWVGEIADVYAQIWVGVELGGAINAHSAEIVDRLMAVDCWRNDLEDHEM